VQALEIAVALLSGIPQYTTFVTEFSVLVHLITGLNWNLKMVPSTIDYRCDDEKKNS
jgi:hypothetical protein